MKTTLTKYDIANALNSDENANWSYAGALALAEYLDENMPEDEEFDRVAIRCDFSQYDSLADWREEYFSDTAQAWDAIGADEDTDEDELDELTREHIQGNGTLIEFDGGIIVSCF